ncbi:MAG: DNA-processing protein DprA [Endomicrobiaceae bacterium]|nr:DNA-processing protein DprA [Endomicrobiaceae bacterium]
MDKEKLAIIKLNMVAELGPKKIVALSNYFGSAYNVLFASLKDLQMVDKITEKIALSIKHTVDSNIIDKEISLAKENGIDIFVYTEENYPLPLKDIYDFPPVLYVKGNIKKNDSVSVAVVGSRMPTNYGRAVTSTFCKYFAENEITVISGLARGIDTEAHQSILKYNGRTIAVLGNGLLEYYPKENKKLQDKISQNCAVISEFPLQQRPDKQHFPRRNRIIAGLSMATVVVEATASSGAIITAELATEYGRDVFAVPGPIFSAYSKGPNNLIKNGSLIALEPQDVVNEIQLLSTWVSKKKKQKKLKTENMSNIKDKNSINILKMIESSINGISTDELSEYFEIDIPELSTILVELELNGFIKAMPGQIYIRNS